MSFLVNNITDMAHFLSTCRSSYSDGTKDFSILQRRHWSVTVLHVSSQNSSLGPLNQPCHLSHLHSGNQLNHMTSDLSGNQLSHLTPGYLVTDTCGQLHQIRKFASFYLCGSHSRQQCETVSVSLIVIKLCYQIARWQNIYFYWCNNISYYQSHLRNDNNSYDIK